MTPESLNHIKLIFDGLKNPQKAVGMEAYMKNLFPFYGITSPERIEIRKKINDTLKIKSLDRDLITLLWKEKERECQYLAMDYLKKYKKQLLPSDIDWVQSLITQKSWWDTVDFLASHIIGHIVSLHPSLIQSHIEPWIIHENMWLNRTAILFQLKYKEKTDFELLKTIILQHLGSKEFFINKACGWALREYAKTNPSAVVHFVETQPELSNLTRREALKHL